MDSTRSFSWKLGIVELACPKAHPHPLSALSMRLCLSTPTHSTYGVEPGLPSPGSSSLLRPCLLQRTTTRCRNVDLLAIDYAVGPHLRSRLNLGGRAWPRKPEVFGERDSHPLYRYLYLHLHFCALQPSLPVNLLRTQNAPLPLVAKSAASVSSLAPVYFRRRFTRPVSYYAFFQGWLLLSQPTGCLCAPTSFPTELDWGTLAGGLGCFPLDNGRYHLLSVSRGACHRYSEFDWGW